MRQPRRRRVLSMIIEVIGGNRIKAVLHRVEDGMDEIVSYNLDKVADQIKSDAQAFCPVDTGSLQASIRKESLARPAGDTWEVGVRAGGYVTNPKTRRIVDYAKYVEFGTSRNMAQPFLRPALLGNQENIRTAILTAIMEKMREGSE